MLEPKPRFTADQYRPAGKLNGKSALITGGDSGIGRAVALLYAREGAKVMITCLPEEQSDAEETKRAIEAAGGACWILTGDLTDAQFCSSLVESAVRELSGLDILVSNAAHQSRKESLEEVTDEDRAHVLHQCLRVFSAGPRCVAAHEPGACIIATSSETGIIGSKKLPDYSATKGAINAFTKALAQALIPRGIRVNAVAPGPVWTPLNPSDPGLTPEKVAKFRQGQSHGAARPAGESSRRPTFSSHRTPIPRTSPASCCK